MTWVFFCKISWIFEINQIDSMGNMLLQYNLNKRAGFLDMFPYKAHQLFGCCVKNSSNFAMLSQWQWYFWTDHRVGCLEKIDTLLVLCTDFLSINCNIMHA